MNEKQKIEQLQKRLLVEKHKNKVLEILVDGLSAVGQALTTELDGHIIGKDVPSVNTKLMTIKLKDGPVKSMSAFEMIQYVLETEHDYLVKTNHDLSRFDAIVDNKAQLESQIEILRKSVNNQRVVIVDLNNRIKEADRKAEMSPDTAETRLKEMKATNEFLSSYESTRAKYPGPHLTGVLAQVTARTDRTINEADLSGSQIRLNKDATKKDGLEVYWVRLPYHSETSMVIEKKYYDSLMDRLSLYEERIEKLKSERDFAKEELNNFRKDNHVNRERAISNTGYPEVWSIGSHSDRMRFVDVIEYDKIVAERDKYRAIADRITLVRTEINNTQLDDAFTELYLNGRYWVSRQNWDYMLQKAKDFRYLYMEEDKARKALYVYIKELESFKNRVIKNYEEVISAPIKK